MNNDLNECVLPLNDLVLIDAFTDMLHFWKVFLPEEEECVKKNPFFRASFVKDGNFIGVYCKHKEIFIDELPRIEDISNEEKFTWTYGEQHAFRQVGDKKV